jgi:hypothetical protein
MHKALAQIWACGVLYGTLRNHPHTNTKVHHLESCYVLLPSMLAWTRHISPHIHPDGTYKKHHVAAESCNHVAQIWCQVHI